MGTLGRRLGHLERALEGRLVGREVARVADGLGLDPAELRAEVDGLMARGWGRPGGPERVEAAVAAELGVAPADLRGQVRDLLASIEDKPGR
jgi:hypothetical protein